jgi:hypothetical protein
MSPDLVKAIKNHQAEMALWWTKSEYVKARKAFCKRNPVCIRCGRKTQTPGHSHDQYQHGFDYYIACVITDRCEPLCNGCNLAEKRGLKPCPVCVKEKCRKIRYISPYGEYCYDHIPQQEKDQREERKEVFKQLVKQSQKITNAKRRAIYQELKQNGRIK